jgi:hypothetical protein
MGYGVPGEMIGIKSKVDKNLVEVKVLPQKIVDAA